MLFFSINFGEIKRLKKPQMPLADSYEITWTDVFKVPLIVGIAAGGFTFAVYLAVKMKVQF